MLEFSRSRYTVTGQQIFDLVLGTVLGSIGTLISLYELLSGNLFGWAGFGLLGLTGVAAVTRILVSLFRDQGIHERRENDHD